MRMCKQLGEAERKGGVERWSEDEGPETYNIAVASCRSDGARKAAPGQPQVERDWHGEEHKSLSGSGGEEAEALNAPVSCLLHFLLVCFRC